uniref:Transglycosylase SLT domain-containing protein n=1 Tax=Oryza nivara TaxID=4536 RepID=A0A0E0G210_ORYNI
MAISFKYWDDCLDPEDMQLMWADPHVSKEWIDAGEGPGQKVHLSRDPDGEAYLTQTEMMAVAAITVHKHFKSQLDPYMIGALAEIASGRRLFVDNYDRKTKEIKAGIMQVTIEVAQWLGRELGYKYYDIEEDANLLYWPFVNVYFGAAYAKWLFSCDDKERTEEFVVRAYKGGKKKAVHKSTSPIFQRYLYVKEALLSMRQPESFNDLTPNLLANSSSTEGQLIYWDSKVSEVDMDAMWSQPDVIKEWTKSGERRGNVRFSHDSKRRPYLSRVEVKAVAEITISRHLSSKGVTPEALAALAELAFSCRDCGHRAYNVSSVDDLYNPFASMYFGAAYLGWLSQYEGRERSHEFIVQAYLGGPENVSLQETGPFWNKFLEALRLYQDPKNSEQCHVIVLGLQSPQY